MTQIEMGEAFLKAGERLDDLHLKGYKIIQRCGSDSFRFGTDAVLLSHFAPVRKGDTVVDLCCGSGIVPILLCTGSVLPRKITGVEIQPELMDMARRSVKLNGLSDIIDIVEADIKNLDNVFDASSVDLVTVNPPYRKINDGKNSPALSRSISRHEVLCTLRDVIKASARLLKSKGRFAIVYRPERAAELFDVMREYKIEPKRLRIVYPNPEASAQLIIVEGRKDGGEGITIEPALYIKDIHGNSTREIELVYGKI